MTMKVLVFILLCCVAAARRVRRQILPHCTDTFKNVANPCTNNPGQVAYFPHPTDITKFIQCDKYKQMYIIQCPENLQYNAVKSQCLSSSMTTTAATGPALVHVNPRNPCTQQALAAGQFNFAVPGDKLSYVECDMLGHANVLPCSSGLVWSDAQLSCIYDTSAGASTSGGIGPGTSGNPCTPQATAAKKFFFPHKDPTKFIQCGLSGNSFEISCPTGLVWKQTLETCGSAFVNGPIAAGRK